MPDWKKANSGGVVGRWDYVNVAWGEYGKSQLGPYTHRLELTKRNGVEDDVVNLDRLTINALVDYRGTRYRLDLYCAYRKEGEETVYGTSFSVDLPPFADKLEKTQFISLVRKGPERDHKIKQYQTPVFLKNKDGGVTIRALCHGEFDAMMPVKYEPMTPVIIRPHTGSLEEGNYKALSIVVEETNNKGVVKETVVGINQKYVFTEPECRGPMRETEPTKQAALDDAKRDA